MKAVWRTPPRRTGPVEPAPQLCGLSFYGQILGGAMRAARVLAAPRAIAAFALLVAAAIAAALG